MKELNNLCDDHGRELDGVGRNVDAWQRSSREPLRKNC